MNLLYDMSIHCSRVAAKVTKCRTTETSKYISISMYTYIDILFANMGLFGLIVFAYIYIYVCRYTICLFGSLTFRDFGIEPFS